MMEIQRSLQKEMKKFFSEGGRHLVEARKIALALYVTGKHGIPPLFQRQIQQYTGSSIASTSRGCMELERLNYVITTGMFDENGKRVKLYRLSPEGASYCKDEIIRPWASLIEMVRKG